MLNVSVSPAPGKSVEDLAVYLPNNQVGVSTVGEIHELGGNVVPKPTINNPFHAEIFGITAE